MRILLEAGCGWNRFNILADDATSLYCVRTVAHGLADRRRELAHLVEEVLTEDQLAGVADNPVELLDSHAATAVQLLRKAGAHVPTALAVPDEYEGIYLSGNLHIGYFPMFFDSGSRDVSHKSGRGFSAMQLVELGPYVYPEAGHPASSS